jgi:dipeptidyl aminopeptidase/acylaminoacyl peptidase
MKFAPTSHSLAVAIVLVLVLLLWISCVEGDGPAGYRKPPKEVLDVLDAAPPPQLSLSPTRDRILLVEADRYPPIAHVAEPMLRLAGLRINPRTNGPHLPPRFVGITLQDLQGKEILKLKLPADARLSMPAWSPDGKRFAFTNTVADAIELWSGDAATGVCRQIGGIRLNGVVGDPIEWMPDSRTLLCRTLPAHRGLPPAPPATPLGPVVQESTGKSGPVRTFQDLLRGPHDEDLLDYYATSQLVLVDTSTERGTPIGKPAIFGSIDPAPDGEHLLVSVYHRPYSYLHTLPLFPHDVEVWNRRGEVVCKVASLPLADRVPIEGVPTGPRSFQWRPTEPGTLVWVEALDDGDPKKKVPFRDRILVHSAPFKDDVRELAKTQHRYAGLTWGAKNGFALLRDYDRDRKWERTVIISADRPNDPARTVWDRSINDRYHYAGAPILRTLPNGHRVLWQSGQSIFLAGPGASPEGDRPFLDRFDLETLKSERMYQCDPDSYESPVALLAEDGSRFLTRRESQSEPPNYFIRSTRETASAAVTHFADPTPQIRGITKQLVTYKRADGVPLSFTLYLPPGHKQGERLPTVVWAYPREFNDADTAGQVVGSPRHFTTITGPSHLFFLLQGYAILDNASLPVVGDPETVNNTYLDQIVAGAKAAIDKAVEMGVTDRDRVGVGGHSYGAFMTANLLAHSNLFRAGIARSGAYNRTLTPFGFQSERRTLWEAPDVYLKMSPFLLADKIKTPILLIHGEADNNPGTFPIQSDRMYQAIRGNGGTVRYVVLPFESHGYQARESVEHTLAEMIDWFDRYVKNPSRTE